MKLLLNSGTALRYYSSVTLRLITLLIKWDVTKLNFNVWLDLFYKLLYNFLLVYVFNFLFIL